MNENVVDADRSHSFNQASAKKSNISLSDVTQQEFPEDSLNHQVVSRKWSFIMVLFMIGIFNNNGYTLVQSGSKSLATAFGKEDFMASFQFAMTSISICTRYLNGSVFVNWSHNLRFTVVSCLGALSFLLIALASWEGTKGREGFFYVAVVASMLTGVS